MAESDWRIRFWTHVDKTAGCWTWTASTVRSGDGQFRVGHTMKRAHRVAWELTYGEPPGSLRNVCGNRRCVRPDHHVRAPRKGMPKNLAVPPIKRFDAMVVREADHWLWGGSADHLGYGQFSYQAPGQSRRVVRAHRFAWEEAHGAIEPGADVLHRCGVRLCVRPDHLELRIGGQAPTRPTPREVDVLRARLRHGLGYGSLKRAAADLGINYVNAATHLMKLRARIDVTSDAQAVTWLDGNEPGWRDGDPRS